MLKAAVMALAIFGFNGSTIHKTDVRTAGWTIQVRKDNFTGGVSCSAKRGEVSFQRSVMVFALGRFVDTTDAEYRLDLGAAHSVHDVAFRVRALGAPVILEPIDNPSRGLVVLPAADVVGSTVVWIRATPRSAPRRFEVGGMRSVLDQEQAALCPSTGL